jgi:hypothetical protein
MVDVFCYGKSKWYKDSALTPFTDMQPTIFCQSAHLVISFVASDQKGLRETS